MAENTNNVPKLKHIKIKENMLKTIFLMRLKTGNGPILLTMSFPYVRDWINEHPFKNTPDILYL